MGNCQAIDAATLVIQHPSGRVDKFYWPVSAAEVMKMNPGHYVALLLSTTLYPPPLTTTTAPPPPPPPPQCPSNNSTTNPNGPVRLTRIKLLRPTDTLVLGHVYRLITTQEVTQGLWAKKQAKMKKNQPESSSERGKDHKQSSGLDSGTRRSEKDHQVGKNERNRPRTATSSTNSATARSRTWQPSLKSISEASGNGS